MATVDFITPRNPFGEFAGVENLAINTAKFLKEKGFNIRIITTDKADHVSKRLGIQVFSFSRPAFGDKFYFSPGLFTELMGSKSDVIHCNGFNNLATFAGLLLKKRGQKLIINLSSSGSSSLLRSLLWAPYLLAFNALSFKIDRLICISDFELGLFSRLLFMVPKEKFSVIPLGVDGSAMKKVRALRDKNLVISAGRLVKNKGFAHVIRAFAIAKRKIPGLKLEIIGDGEEKARLIEESEISGAAAKFIPAMNNPDRADFFKRLKSASIFMLLSDYESQGVVVSEAITAGTPCIVSNKTALAEFGPRNKAIVVDNHDYAGIAEKIIKVASNPEKYRPAPAGIISWEEAGEKTLSIYASLGVSKIAGA